MHSLFLSHDTGHVFRPPIAVLIYVCILSCRLSREVFVSPPVRGPSADVLPPLHPCTPYCVQARVCGELVAADEESLDGARATAERDASARNFLAVSRAGVRALVSPSPGLKIGPEEIRRYMAASMASIPWE